MAKAVLDFEKPIFELEQKIREMEIMSTQTEVDMTHEIEKLREKLTELAQKTNKNLTRWQRVELARHPDRPHSQDYIERIATQWTELHGDRLFRDDHAILTGLAMIKDERVVIIGQEKGRSTKEKLYHNFGMPNPEGYRKAMRAMQLAEKFHLPVISLIDTQGAYPGLEAEERGQAEAIARNLLVMSKLRVPIICVVIGEGASGGALGIGVGDRLLMLENTWYSVITPEGCASILYRDANQKEKAAEAMKLSAQDLLDMKIADKIIHEPLGGAHREYDAAAKALEAVLTEEIKKLKVLDESDLVNSRIEKLSQIGVWEE
ncbi:MAG: acetyl-CoA carboxylase carboxyltransferase subunit alpha [Candidatus Marinimicrobia bacterium]|nr:acetyl-CoA carboxylase carboxyltransferase subunit alpha [Candidatus Neomarinimicrobiota bacterium]MCF7839580.1 acetyl-CoA carboxylase carboxyltransferase subunit alpha [Candidatus Neomarinimicrobiota bacterium]